MMRESIREEETTTISRFLSGLPLKLLPYRDLNDLVQLCIKVEQQNLRKGSRNKESSYSNSYPKKVYKRDYKREESYPKEKPKLETPKGLDRKKKCANPHKRTREIQRIKCLGRGHITSQFPNR